MGEDVLCSYLAISEENADKVADLFTAARYEGPFGQRKRYFWQEDVDDVLADLAEASGFEGDIGDDQFRRQLMQAHLDPGAHVCPRCEGVRGGFRCPYTNRTTCERADCSVPSTSWVPQGAYLTRVEKNYYERWAPLLGL
jgi:hypothetical protein